MFTYVNFLEKNIDKYVAKLIVRKKNIDKCIAKLIVRRIKCDTIIIARPFFFLF